MRLPVVTYPGLSLHALVGTLPHALGEMQSPDWLTAMLRPDPAAPKPAEAVRTAVRDLLRVHGYRPTGRGKPSSEYLVAASADGRLTPINAVVDAGNAVSLRSGLPISVVDLDLCVPPLRVLVPGPGATYVFNRSGQEIDVAGLVSLCDAGGPCANAVKDAQRTKTTAVTRRVLAIVWGAQAPDAAHAPATAAALRETFERLGLTVENVIVDAMPA